MRRSGESGLEEEDELDGPFAMGAIIDNEIPWKDFDEVEIQGLLKLHFEDLGYKVIWRHRQDPANEEGVDLECIRKTPANRVVIAVKKKPKHDDISQVLELSNTDANRRIYVYVEGCGPEL